VYNVQEVWRFLRVVGNEEFWYHTLSKF
jgi:hypothetical protein